MKALAILATLYAIGSNLWAYPTIDGFTIGMGQYGYHVSYNKGTN